MAGREGEGVGEAVSMDCVDTECGRVDGSPIAGGQVDRVVNGDGSPKADRSALEGNGLLSLSALMAQLGERLRGALPFAPFQHDGLPEESPQRAPLLNALSKAALEESQWACSGGRSRHKGLTRSMWRRKVCRVLAALVGHAIPPHFDDILDESWKLDFRRGLANKCRLLLNMSKQNFRASSEFPYFLRHPEQAAASDLRAVFGISVETAPKGLEDGLDEKNGNGGHEGSGDFAATEVTRASLMSRLRRVLGAMVTSPQDAAPVVLERHLGILEHYLGAQAFDTEPLGESPVEPSVGSLVGDFSTRCAAVLRGIARVLGMDALQFAADTRLCPSFLRIHWEGEERWRVQRDKLIPFLHGLCVEQAKRQKHRQPQRNPAAYMEWQRQALARLARVLGCTEDVETVRAACAAFDVQFPEFFQGDVNVGAPDEIEDRVVPALSEELRAAMQGNLAGRSRFEGRRSRPRFYATHGHRRR